MSFDFVSTTSFTAATPMIPPFLQLFKKFHRGAYFVVVQLVCSTSRITSSFIDDVVDLRSQYVCFLNSSAPGLPDEC